MSGIRSQLLIAGLCLACAGRAAAADDLPTYRLKGESHTGSMLPTPAATGNLPYDKRYDQMTEAQKAVVKSRYEPMQPGDEPPFPIDGLGPLMKNVAKVGNALFAGGSSVDMAVEVDPEGNARSVSIFHATSDEQTTKAIASLLMVQKYKPAICGGKPCTMAFPLYVEFTVR